MMVIDIFVGNLIVLLLMRMMYVLRKLYDPLVWRQIFHVGCGAEGVNPQPLPLPSGLQGQ